jgi:glycosyltransferase involved in cell wall biosynthesis
MGGLNQKILGFFLTEKMSLKNWERAGILKREIAPYNLLADYFKKIYLFTYDGKEELEYKKYLAPNIEIVYKRWRMRAKDYRWLLSFLNWRKIRECDFFKTNQLKCRAALIAKIIHPKAKLILRTGYTQSLFEEKQKGQASPKIVRWEKIAYKLADKGLLTSENDKEYLIKKYKIRSEKLTVMVNYIDTELFKPMTGEKYNERIVFVGRINKQKNLLELAKALVGTNITLDIIGETDNKAGVKIESERIKNELLQISKNNNPQINFLGRISNKELPGVLNKYKIFVLPSLYEGMPKSLLEAMSTGLACIGTKVEGIKELIKNNETGLLSETNNGSLKENLLKLMANENLQKELGDNARKFVVENFSLATQIKKEVEIYEKFSKQIY